VLYNEGTSGSSSVVERDLAKVDVAGSTPVSRSIHFKIASPSPVGLFSPGTLT
jgi:hypothetical protein